MLARLAVTLCFGCLCPPVHAAETFRWVDELGRASFGSPAPDKFAKSATKVACEAAWKEYLASQECFGPYMTRSGSVRAEAYHHCKVVMDPARACGPARPASSERR
jgi:hypothetical protein